MPQDDEVYTLKNVMEGMNFDELLKRYSNKGRKGYNPIMIYSLLLYANIRGVREIDKVVKLCERDICFMWLSQGQNPKRDVFYNFINNRVTIEILEDLHYQYIRRLHKEGYLMLDTLF
jgi:transposase